MERIGKPQLLRIFALFLVLLLAFLCSPSIAAQEEEQPELSAPVAAVFNADHQGEILFSKGEEESFRCGFLPQVMTCILLLESGRDLTEEITMTEEMLSYTTSLSGAALTTGKTISLADLMTCVLCGNSQEAVVGISLTLQPTLTAMVEKMNARAAELGAKNTVFTNVTGVGQDNWHTTVSDCALLISHALQFQEIQSVGGARFQEITVNGKTRRVYNRNMLFERDSDYYCPSATGLFFYSYENNTETAVAVYRKDPTGILVSLVCTDQGKPSMYADATALLEFSKNRYTTRTLISKGSTVTEIKVVYGKDVDYLVLTAQSTVSVSIPKLYSEEAVVLQIDAAESVEAPVEKGTKYGTVTILCAGKEYGTVDLVAAKNIARSNYAYYESILMKVFNNKIVWTILIVLLLLIVGYIFLMYYINKPRRKTTDGSDSGNRLLLKKKKEKKKKNRHEKEADETDDDNFF